MATTPRDGTTTRERLVILVHTDPYRPMEYYAAALGVTRKRIAQIFDALGYVRTPGRWVQEQKAPLDSR